MAHRERDPRAAPPRRRCPPPPAADQPPPPPRERPPPPRAGVRDSSTSPPRRSPPPPAADPTPAPPRQRPQAPTAGVRDSITSAPQQRPPFSAPRNETTDGKDTSGRSSTNPALGTALPQGIRDLVGTVKDDSVSAQYFQMLRHCFQEFVSKSSGVSDATRDPSVAPPQQFPSPSTQIDSSNGYWTSSRRSKPHVGTNRTAGLGVVLEAVKDDPFDPDCIQMLRDCFQEFSSQSFGGTDTTRDFLMTENDESLNVEYLKLLREGFEDFLVQSFGAPSTSRLYLLPEDEGTKDPRDHLYTHLGHWRFPKPPPAFLAKAKELADRLTSVFSPSIPPVEPPATHVGARLFGVIQGRYTALSDSIKNAAAYAKSLADCCIKNEQSVKALEDRVSRVEEQVDLNIQAAKDTLETMRETKLIQEKIYELLKKRVDILSERAGETKLERIKRVVEYPAKVAGIIITIAGYPKLIEELTGIFDEIFGKKPERAEEIITELEEIVTKVETFEIKESSYSLIGGVCTGLLNDLYPLDIFSITVSDSKSYITSRITEKKANEVVLMGRFISGSEIKLVTDMASNGTLSFGGQLCEGLTETLSFSIPNKNAELLLNYQHPLGGCCGVIGTRPSPRLRMSGILGLKQFAVGGDVQFDFASKKFLKYDCGVGFDNELYSASVAISNKCDLLRATVASKLWPGWVVGAEATCSNSTGNKTVCLGALHQYNSDTILKAKMGVDSEGGCVGAAAVDYKWNKGSSVSLSYQLKYTKDKETVPRFGLGITIVP